MSKSPEAAVVFGQSGKAFQEGMKQLIELNLQTLKTMMSEYIEGFQAAVSSKTPEEFFKVQSEVLKAMPEKATAYIQHVKEIFATATVEEREAGRAQVADMQAKFLEATDGALKNVPGSEGTVNLMKTAMAATDDAFDGASKMSKQITNATDANIAKVNETAGKFAKSAAKSAT